MKLRDYQCDLIDLVRTSFSHGHRRVLAVLPPGAGKTVCFAFMAYQHVSRTSSARVWFLVHRRELVEQARATFTAWGLTDTHIYVGMVQTISRRLSRGITPEDTPTLIIYDEAHHATSTTWQRIVSAYPRVPTVGLTATPARLDGDALGAVFDDICVGVDAPWLIDRGYLAPYDYYAPRTVDMRTVSLRGADYDADGVADVLLKSHIYGDVMRYINKNNKTIIYCPTVAFSRDLASRITGAVHFDADTPTAERDAIVQAFRAGTVRVLTNVDLIGEGFDVPDCDTVMLLRPTQSVTLYIQQAMRGMRPHGNKRATIYDFVGNCYRHGLPTDHREWSLSGRMRAKNPSGDPDVTARLCSHCMRVYAGVSAVCPYCGHHNGKTRAQIQADEKAELERIETAKKLESRRQQGRAQTYGELIQLGRDRGYKHPEQWARYIIRSRGGKN